MLRNLGNSVTEASVDRRADELFGERYCFAAKRVDRLFAGLLIVEWIAAMFAAHFISPKTWAGSSSETHIHVWSAVLLGFCIVIFPVFLAARQAGTNLTRHCVAIGQMLMSALLIHLSGGRIETHFHVFGSLAFLAFYRDWRVLMTASVVVAADHLLRSVLWPQSVFGVLNASPARALEHAGWVVFEVVFLTFSCVQGVREMRTSARQHAQFEATQELIEAEVEKRTHDLKVSQQRLQASEAEARKLAMVARRTDNTVIVTDRDGYIEWANEGFEHCTGYSLEEVVGKKPGDFLQGPETDPETVRHMSEMLKEGRGFSVEVVNYTKAGQKYWQAIEVQPVHDDAGDIQNYIAIETDITLRKKNSERMRIAVEASPSGMVMISRAGEIVMVNSKTEQLFGCSRNDLIGESFGKLLPGHFEDRSPGAFEVAIDRLTLDHEDHVHELIGHRKDGTTFPVEVGLNPIETEDGRFVLAAIVDMTERKRIEQELREFAELVAAKNSELQSYAEEVEAANKAKSEFLTNMSHELRTPLNAVIGFSDGLIERADRHPLNKHQLDRLHKIKKSGEHLLTLINNVLDIAKIESGSVEIHATQFEVIGLVEETAALAEGLLKDNPNVRFDIDIEPDLPALTSDRDKVKQILINLLGNACKFTQQGTVTLRVQRDGEYIRWNVEDTGVGIPETELHRVFEKFHQIDQSTHSSIKGTGLGLALCRSFAEKLGAALTVKSVFESGSTFCLTTPIELNEARIEQLDQMAQKLRSYCLKRRNEDGRGRVLCVEDDPLSMQLLVDYLEEDGFIVLPAFSGEEGLEIASREAIDIITLDVMLPGLDGWEVLRRLKAQASTASIPVILSTAIDERNLAVNLGADDYIVKPVEHVKIRDSISRLSTKINHPVQTVVVVDDDADTLEILVESIEEQGYVTRPFLSGVQLLDSLCEPLPDLIILDLMMPDMDGFAVIDALRANALWKDIPVILVTAKSLTANDLSACNGRVRAVVEKNGLARDQALAQLVGHIRRLSGEEINS